jgi:membrane-associated protease RseP (regulator of RpoE activity)
LQWPTTNLAFVEAVLLFVLGVVIFVIGLGVSIGLHELGHLSFAKLFGVKVTQYMIGFGKTLFSFRRGETEYGVKALPLGGYISMIGMFPPKHPGEHGRNASTGFYNQVVQDARTASADTVADGEEDRTFYRLSPWKRIIIMFAGPFMNLVIAFVLLAVIVTGIGVQVNNVAEVSKCIPSSPSVTSCAANAPQSPAAAAGFKPGDIIQSIDGKQMAGWNESTAVFQKSAGKTLSVIVENDGKQRTISVTPKATTRYVLDAEGKAVVKDGVKKTQTVGVVGLTPGVTLVHQPITAVMPALGANIAAVANIVIDLPQRMVAVWNAAFGPEQRAQDSPVGLVGVGRFAGDIASNDTIPVIGKVQTMLSLLASLNVALFVMNMIPLLPLDGGHIIGAIWEWIRRAFAKLFKRRDPGPVDMAKLMPITFVVIIVLGGMSLLLAYADIVKPVNLLG